MRAVGLRNKIELRILTGGKNLVGSKTRRSYFVFIICSIGDSTCLNPAGIWNTEGGTGSVEKPCVCTVISISATSWGWPGAVPAGGGVVWELSDWAFFLCHIPARAPPTMELGLLRLVVEVFDEPSLLP